MRASAAAWLVCAVALVGGCGGAGVGGPEWTVAQAQPAPEPEAPPLELGAIVIAALESSEPLLVLEEDGTAHHADCPMSIAEDGTVRGAEGDVVVRLVGEAIVGAGERTLYRLEGERMARADGRTARVEGERIVFEESEDLTLRVEGAETLAQRRTVLVLIAALSVCGS